MNSVLSAATLSSKMQPFEANPFASLGHDLCTVDGLPEDKLIDVGALGSALGAGGADGGGRASGRRQKARNADMACW